MLLFLGILLLPGQASPLFVPTPPPALCPAGKYRTPAGHHCTCCPAGHFQPVPSTAACTLCPQGKHIGNHYTDDDAHPYKCHFVDHTKCLDCPAGTVSVPAGIKCECCPAGRFQPVPAATG